MRHSPRLELPPEQQAQLKKARRLEWISVLYTASAALCMFLTRGASQVMKTGFFEDVLSTIPALAFLVTSRIALRKPRPDYPYGYHRAISIGHLTASLALVTMGAFLLIEAVLKLLSGERPTIGGVTLFGTTIWAGWLMLAAVAYTGIPTIFLGRAKLKIAPKFHDKVLFADAKMMKADWMTGLATAIGVLGVGFGLWWLDALAAALVSLDILHDGASNVRVAVTDLMDRYPRKTDESGQEAIPELLARHMEKLDWVRAADVRMREEGHVFFGEIYVVPRSTDHIAEKLRQAVEHARALDWRVFDVTVTPVERL